MRPARIAALVAALGMLLVGAGCGSSSSSGGSTSSSASTSSTGASGKKLKVVWLWYGPKNDGGYNVSQWRPAQEQIAQKYGDRVEQVDIEKVPYSARGSQMADQAMRDGADLVIDAVAAGNIFTSVCGRHPDVKCLEVGPVGDYPDAAAPLPVNVSGVFHEFWNLEYLAGMAAGMMTKTNTLGFVGSYKNPAVVGSADAYALGCQRVNPDCQVRVIITNDYFNPSVAVQASNTLVSAGADVLHGWTDDPGFCEVAERRGVRVVGQFLDYRDVCPKAFITSTLWDYGPYYLDQIGKLVDGSWKGHEATFLKLDEGADLAKWGENVPAAVKQAVAKEAAAIKGGTSPFTGPIYDNAGKLRVKPGVTLGPEYLYNQLTWYVKGVVA